MVAATPGVSERKRLSSGLPHPGVGGRVARALSGLSLAGDGLRCGRDVALGPRLQLRGESPQTGQRHVRCQDPGGNHLPPGLSR